MFQVQNIKKMKNLHRLPSKSAAFSKPFANFSGESSYICGTVDQAGLRPTQRAYQAEGCRVATAHCSSKIY
jgi:hypothetical protein